MLVSVIYLPLHSAQALVSAIHLCDGGGIQPVVQLCLTQPPFMFMDETVQASATSFRCAENYFTKLALLIGLQFRLVQGHRAWVLLVLESHAHGGACLTASKVLLLLLLPAAAEPQQERTDAQVGSNIASLAELLQLQQILLPLLQQLLQRLGITRAAVTACRQARCCPRPL